MGPIDYSVSGVQNPLLAASQGLQFGVGIRSLQDAQAQREMEMQAAAERQRQAQAMAAEFTSVANNPNATERDFIALMTKFPQLSEQLKRPLDALSAKAKQGRIDQASQVYAAIKAGQPEVAVNLLKRQAEAARNSGNEQDAVGAEAYAQLIQANPTGARGVAASLLAATTGEKFAETFGKVGEEQRAQDLAPAKLAQATAEAEKTGAEAKSAQVAAQYAPKKAEAELEAAGWNVKNIRSQIGERAGRLKLDQDRLAADTMLRLQELGQKAGEIPGPAQTEINNAATAATTAKASAAQFLSLADRLEATGGGYGVAASASEWFKKVGGFENGMTELRKEYVRLRNTDMGRQLKAQGGTASDTDVKLYSAGFLPETADARTLASFLRGAAKAQAIEAAVNNAKADWLAANKGLLGRAKSSGIAGDYAFRAGESYADFIGRVTAGEIEKISKGGTGGPPRAEIPQNSRPGAVSQQPGAQPNPLFDQADAILLGGRR